MSNHAISKNVYFENIHSADHYVANKPYRITVR